MYTTSKPRWKKTKVAALDSIINTAIYEVEELPSCSSHKEELLYVGRCLYEYIRECYTKEV